MPAKPRTYGASLCDTLRLVPGWQSAAIEIDSKPLAGGRTNCLTLVIVDGGRYVVRVASPHSELLSIRRSDEIATMRAAAAVGIAPHVVWSDNQRGILVSEFVAGRHWLPEDIRRSEAMTRLVEQLRCAHALHVDTSKFDPVAVGQAMERNCSVDAPPLAARRRWLSRVGTVMSRAQPPLVSCLCHNDIVRDNFIDDGTRLWFIDWECAGLGDPLYDLAVISHNNRLSLSEECELLRLYLPSLTTSGLEHLQRMKVTHDFYHVFWYGSQLTSESTPDDFRQGLNFHAARLDKELRAFAVDGSYSL